MDQSFACVLLLLSLAFGKYVYIEQKKTWHEAQKYCQMFYTDLAPVSNKHDIYQLERLVGESEDYFWIGMERDSTDTLKWMWSGGGEVSTFFWALGEPDNRQHEDYVMIHYNRMYDAEADFEDHFFCYRQKQEPMKKIIIKDLKKF
uniref:C-type lectin domain-containing protein n=1 Tax=Seriola lalandi dorsalis TaxID=1841481 RepID=A0A3B4WXR2_SERLL